MLKAGVLGCGHLGKIHIKLMNQSESFDVNLMQVLKKWLKK